MELAPFYLGKCPVTNEEYARFLAANPDGHRPADWERVLAECPRHPVVHVSYHDAGLYCLWAAGDEGLLLPTEAQWEYACRAGTTTRYWSGDDEEDLARVGWYYANSGGSSHAVGEKPANPFGVYDMHGNVEEWCWEHWHAGYKGARTRAGDGYRVYPESAERFADYRVVRGGMWNDLAKSVRSASRSSAYSRSRYWSVGFRPRLVVPRNST